MVLITLVGEKQATEGCEFIYMGPLSDCRECRLKTVCFNLEEGTRYKITKIRDVHHDCKIHEGGVRVVEVERIPVNAALNNKLAIEGSTITFAPLECKNLGCEHYHLCHPLGVKANGKYKILSVGKEIKCPVGEKIKEVKMRK